MPQFLNRDEYEATIQRELNRIHKEARATLLDLFPLDMFGNVLYDEDKFLQAQPEWGEFYNAIRAQYRRELTPIIGFVFAESAENLELTRAFAVADDIVTDSSENWAQRWVNTLVTDMSETNQRQIDRYIAEYRADPEVGLEWLRERLGRIVSPSRAEMVASTEITRANYEGEAFIANQLRNEGIDLVAVWFTAVDERVCPICGANHNKPRGEGWQLPPPAHPRCRCWVNWVEKHLVENYVQQNEGLADEPVSVVQTITQAEFMSYDLDDKQWVRITPNEQFYKTKTLKELSDYMLANATSFEVQHVFNSVVTLDANANFVFDKKRIADYVKRWVAMNRYSEIARYEYTWDIRTELGYNEEDGERNFNAERANESKAVLHIVDLTKTKITKQQRERLNMSINGQFLDMMFLQTNPRGSIAGPKRKPNEVRRGYREDSPEYRKAKADWEHMFG